jgi:hypothetical protein
VNTLQGNIVNANGPTAPRRARHSAESPQRVRRESAERRERSPRSVAARARTPTAPPRRGSVSAPRVRPRRWTSPGLGVALGDGPCDRALRRPTCGRTPGRGPRGIKFFAFSRQRATAPRTMPYPAARAHPRSPVISTRRRPRGGSSLRTRAPGVGKGHGRSLLPTRISRPISLRLPSVSVGRGPKSKLFREAISSPALQHILMYHKRAYALVRDLRPTDSPEGHTYYTNPGRGRLLCHRLRRTTAYLDDLPIELESQSRPS